MPDHVAQHLAVHLVNPTAERRTRRRPAPRLEDGPNVDTQPWVERFLRDGTLERRLVNPSKNDPYTRSRAHRSQDVTCEFGPGWWSGGASYAPSEGNAVHADRIGKLRQQP